MAREPSDRFPAAVDLADALEAHATGALAKQETPVGMRLLIGAGAAGLFALALVSAVVVWASVGTLRELGGGALGYVALALLGATLTGATRGSTSSHHWSRRLQLARCLAGSPALALLS